MPSEFPRMELIGSPVSENEPRETVRKGVRVTSEASILVVSSNEIELLGLFSSVFEASGRSYQDFSDSLRRVLLGNPHSPGPMLGALDRPTTPPSPQAHKAVPPS